MSLDVTKELSQNFIEYAVAVNTDRSIPDAKSGLKPVARRILYGSYNTGRTSNKPFVKNARIVGDVMGALHPHGDSSIYGSLVRLSQGWVMRYPLMDFHGNQGSINGDGAAAMRYTEGRLSKLAEEGLLKGLKKNAVDTIPTYDDSEREPVTLPAIFPNLLCNPNSGIGVSLACNWACHNLREVQQAILDYMDGKEPMLPGPDFPTGGVVINKNDIPSIMKTGKGTVKIRSKYRIEDNKIIFYEIPYGTTVEALMTEIGEYSDNNLNVGIKEVKDQTNSKGVKIVIECKKDAVISRIIQQLFQKTNLQSSFSYNQIALIDKIPTEMNLKDCCRVYVEHNLDCLCREINFDLQQAKDRLHIVCGLLIALEDIDNVIQLIKNSESSSAAKIKLQEKYKLTEIQAKSILAMRLSSLAKLEKLELENEKKDLLEKIKSMEALLGDEEGLKNCIKNRLADIVLKYGDERRTDLEQITVPKEEKEIVYVEPEKCVVIMTEGGLIKRIPATNFRTQKRNGVGIKTQDDITNAVIRTNTIDSLMIFSDKGKMYKLLVDEVPVGTNVSKGQHVRTLVEMASDEKPVTIYSIYRDTDAEFVLFVTKNGLVKKTPLSDYNKSAKRKNGIAATALRDGDELAAVTLIKDETLLLITKQGQIIHFNSSEISPSSRITTGVKGMSLADNDEIVAVLPVRNITDRLAVFAQNGLGKSLDLLEFPLQKRAGKGTYCYHTSDITGPVVAATLVEDKDMILIAGDKSSICINASDIPLSTKRGNGYCVIKNNKILSVSKV